MSPSAKYVTQSSIYDCPMLGRLTNRKINKYKEMGFYATNVESRVEKTKKKRDVSKKNALKMLLGDLI